MTVTGPPSPIVCPAPAFPPRAQDYLWTLQQSFDGGKTWSDMLINLSAPAQGTWTISDSIKGRAVLFRYVRETRFQ